MDTPYESRLPIWADEFRCRESYQNFRSKGTPEWLLLYTVGGGGRVQSTGQEVRATAGTIHLFEPGALQRYGTDPEVKHWHILWVHFQARPHWAEWLHWPRVGKGLLEIQLDDSAVKREFRAAMRETIRHCQRQLLPMSMNALERGLLWVHSTAGKKPLDERIRRAMDLLLEKMTEPFSVAALATECGLSTSRLAHLFREETGTSPGQYLEQLRLDRAAQLLRSTGLNIGEIAAATGYPDAFYFSNRFKKFYRSSPSEYRAKTNEAG